MIDILHGMYAVFNRPFLIVLILQLLAYITIHIEMRFILALHIYW